MCFDFKVLLKLIRVDIITLANGKIPDTLWPRIGLNASNDKKHYEQGRRHQLLHDQKVWHVEESVGF